MACPQMSLVAAKNGEQLARARRRLLAWWLARVCRLHTLSSIRSCAGTDGFQCCCVERPPREAEALLVEYSFPPADCLAGSFPAGAPPNASFGALEPPVPGSASCLDGGRTSIFTKCLNYPIIII